MYAFAGVTTVIGLSPCPSRLQELHHRVRPGFRHLVDDVDAAALQFDVGEVGPHFLGDLPQNRSMVSRVMFRERCASLTPE